MPANRSTRRLLPLALVGTTAGAGLAVGVVLAIASGALADRTDGPTPEPTDQDGLVVDLPADVQRAPGAGRADPSRYTPVVQAVESTSDAVVTISTRAPSSDPFAMMWGAPRETSGEGSGVVIDPEGVVLTNAHVVERASSIVATFADGRAFDAEMIGVAPELDLAVLVLHDSDGARLSGTHAVDIGRSSELMLGEPVIAIGNAMGLGLTVTTGVVSSTSRTIETDSRVYQDFIQTDAAINPGNSGGALLDVHGRLIGINTAIRADAQNIGFAIPSDRALKVARDLLAFGTVQIPWLGVDLSDVAMRDRTGRRVAVRVDEVLAETSTLAVGDVIVSVDGRAVQGRADLNAYLANFPPGRTVSLGVWRDQVEQTVAAPSRELPASVVDDAIERVLGVKLEPTSGSTSGRARAAGVRVTRAAAGGSFAKAGLRVGDVIVAVNGRPVQTEEQLRQAVVDVKSSHRGTALLSIQRGGAFGRVNVEI